MNRDLIAIALEFGKSEVQVVFRTLRTELGLNKLALYATTPKRASHQHRPATHRL